MIVKDVMIKLQKLIDADSKIENQEIFVADLDGDLYPFNIELSVTDEDDDCVVLDIR